MPVEVIMPKVDMDMAKGILSRWHVKEGDTVTQGEPLFDIETDKSNMEIEAPASGVLQQVVASNGDTVDIGVCIAQIYSQGEQLVSVRNPSDSARGARDESVGDQSTIDQGHAGSVSNAGVSGLKALTASGSGIEGGQSISQEQVEKVRATPLARKLAEQHNVSLNGVTGSGPRGRITKLDVLSAAEKTPPVDSSSRTRPLTQASTAQLDSLGIAYTRLPPGRMRSIIAERLTESKSSVPHFYLEADLRVDRLQSFRADLNDALGNDVPVKVSLNDLVVMAAAKALDAVPEANVSWAGNEIIQYHDANISVAVSVDGGLMTPVVRGAQTKSISFLATELSDLSTRARLGKLSPQEYQGGSMSVTNLGMFGVQRFKAIINPPESMILAIGSAGKKVVVGDNDQPTVASIMSVCLSCDHRVVDGVVAARWLKAFQDRIENPVRLML